MLFSFLPTFLNSDIIILFVLVLNEYNISIFPQQFCAFVYIYISMICIKCLMFSFLFLLCSMFFPWHVHITVCFLWSLLNLYYASLLQLSVIWGCFEFSLSSIWLIWTIIIKIECNSLHYICHSHKAHAAIKLNSPHTQFNCKTKTGLTSKQIQQTLSTSQYVLQTISNFNRHRLFK